MSSWIYIYIYIYIYIVNILTRERKCPALVGSHFSEVKICQGFFVDTYDVAFIYTHTSHVFLIPPTPRCHMLLCRPRMENSQG